MKKIITPSELPGDDPLGFLGHRLETCRERLDAAAARSGRSPTHVRLIAVTKYVDPAVVRLLHRLGLRDFGENRIQEAELKAESLRDLEDLRLHFIGHLQRNKVRKALGFASLASLDSLALLEELEKRLAGSPGSLPAILVEVNISGEDHKTGLPPEGLEELLEAAARNAEVGPRIRGLMGMAPLVEEPEAARPFFRRLRELRDRHRDAGFLPPDAELSMGMSADFEVAVEEGATLVRLGTTLYAEDEP